MASMAIDAKTRKGPILTETHHEALTSRISHFLHRNSSFPARVGYTTPVGRVGMEPAVGQRD